MQIYRQRWWKRSGFWLGLVFFYSGVGGVLSHSGWWRFLDLVLAILAVFFAAHGWRQRVVVDDRGIRVHRLARRRRADWGEIERFDKRGGAVALLRDGSTLPLFDWAGDSERIIAELERERAVRQQTNPGDVG